MNCRSAAFSIGSWISRAGLRSSQRPRRSRESQPYTSGTPGHFTCARRTISSTLGGGESLDRLRHGDAESLGVSDAGGLQQRDDVVVLDALADHADTDYFADARDRVQLRARDVARCKLADDHAVHFHVVHAQRLERLERYRAAPEAIEQQPAPDRFHGGGEARGSIRAREKVVLVDLEH